MSWFRKLFSNYSARPRNTVIPKEQEEAIKGLDEILTRLFSTLINRYYAMFPTDSKEINQHRAGVVLNELVLEDLHEDQIHFRRASAKFVDREKREVMMLEEVREGVLGFLAAKGGLYLSWGHPVADMWINEAKRMNPDIAIPSTLNEVQEAIHRCLSMKTKKSSVELGSDLSSLFLTENITPIVKESLNAVEEDQRSWRFKIKIGSTDDIALAKEWILFEMFIFGQAILGYFKGNVIGKRIYWSFNETCGNDLVEYNIFDSLDEFADLLQQRSKYYLDTLRLDGPDDTYILSLSKRLLDQISGGKGNVLYLSAIGKYYFEMSSMYRKLVREIMAKIYFVD